MVSAHFMQGRCCSEALEWGLKRSPNFNHQILQILSFHLKNYEHITLLDGNKASKTELNVAFINPESADRYPEIIVLREV